MSIQKSICWGIDLGTTNSELAIMSDSSVRIVESKFHEATTPSAVYFLRNGGAGIEVEAGKKAKQRLSTKPSRVACEFKQSMGNPAWSFKVGGLDHEESAAQLSGRILRELKNSVQRQEGLPALRAAVVTVPAAFKNPQFDDTRRAAEMAGIEYVELLPEPVAAALAYGRTTPTKHNPIWLAYDLGGGTFDAALVRAEDGLFSIIDHEGDRNLGGKNLDNAIVMDLIRPRLPHALQQRIVPWQSPEWWILKAAAEEAKTLLSVDESTLFEATLDDHEITLTLTQADINALQVKLFARTLDLCRQLLSRNDLTPGDIEKVILVGGPTLLPFLRRMIQHGAPNPTDTTAVEGLGIEIDGSVNPLTAVAEGAAIYAAGRSIPAGILADLVDHETAGARVAIDLSVPAQVREADVLAAGTLRSLDTGVDVTGAWAVVFDRLDAAGQAIWQSEPVPVSAAGKFAKRLPLQEGSNVFRVQVLDAQRDPVPTADATFQVLNDIGVGGLTLTRGIGIADEEGRTVWFFTKGEGLPTRSSKAFLTTVGVSRNGDGRAIEIPIVEGTHEQASLNREIYTMRITADDVHVSISQGSNIIVTLAINESKEIEILASLEDYDDLDFSSNLGAIPLCKSEISKSFEKLTSDLNLFKRVRGMDAAIDALLHRIEARDLIPEIEDLLAQGSESHPEPWDSAADRILEVAALCDPHCATVDLLLAWEPHQAYCDRNVDMAKQIVGETSGIPSDWLWKFKESCGQYECACQDRDRERSEEIAYSEIPELFKTNDHLRERVGGGVSEVKGDADQTTGSGDRRGTIRKL